MLDVPGRPFFGFSSTVSAAFGAKGGWIRVEFPDRSHPMPPDPKRVQAVFLEAAECQDPEERGAILDRECSDDPELRGRVEALLRAHDQFNGTPNEPIIGPRAEHRALADGDGLIGEPPSVEG
jgi:hypothetical protein